MLSFIGNLIPQCGHFQNKKDITIKIVNNINPIIFKMVIDKNPPIRFAGIDTNKHIKENLQSLIRFFTFPITLLPPL